AIAKCDRMGVQALAPTREAQDRFNQELQRRLAGSVWNSGGCRSWYLDEHGKNTVLWCGYTWQYWLTTRSVNPAEYRFFGIGNGLSSDRATVAAAN
ncbi:4-hydroxyacetophenone monooxygenase, partial [Mycobacterium tuberculosis]